VAYKKLDRKSTVHTWAYTDAKLSEVGEGYEFLTDSRYDSEAEGAADYESVYTEQSAKVTNLDSGSAWTSYRETWQEGSTGEGYDKGNEWSYDNAIQQNYYTEYNYDYSDMYTQYGVNRFYPRALEEEGSLLGGDLYVNIYNTIHSFRYNYEEWALTDSDQREINWNKTFYTVEDGNNYRTSYEAFGYELDSDAATVWSRYEKTEYIENNTNTVWHEEHLNSLVTDAYDDFTSGKVEGTSLQEKTVGQDLDFYYEETYTETFVENEGLDRYYSEYELSLANGNQEWEEKTYSVTTDARSWTDLTDGAGNWTGTKL